MSINGSERNELCRREDMDMHPHDASSEASLIHAAQAGMPGAMDELLVRHRGVLYGTARRFTNSHEDAEDLVQDAMLRAFINIRKFRGDARFRTWLVAIVNNTALSMKRKQKAACWISIDDTRKESYDSPGWEFPDSSFSPEQELIWQEFVSVLKTAISAKSQRYQIVIRACMLNEQSAREAAPALGITIASAKSRLFRVRRGLFESFVRRGLVKRRAVDTVGTVSAISSRKRTARVSSA